MSDSSLNYEDCCATCGGTLRPGPEGPRCSRCMLALVAAQGEDDREELVAELFPEMKLLGAIAHGGFGAVYRAEHRRMKRQVALKFLDTFLAKAPEAVALFEQEMISVGSLDHPGIVRAYDAGEREGHWYIVMEFLDGPDCGMLSRKHGALPVAEACEIVRQAALALHFAHEQGLVHRDVKPGNLMLVAPPGSDQRTAVKVLDFGLAGFAVAPAIASLANPRTERMLIGTLEYCAPEQIETPDQVDARADVFGLGATLRRLLTGQPPRAVSADGETSLFVRMKVITAEPILSISTARPGLPPELVRLCDRLLALHREDRPESAAEVAALLESWSAGADLSRLGGEGSLPEKPIRRRIRWKRLLLRTTATICLVTLGVFGMSWRVFFPGKVPHPAPERPALRQGPLPEISEGVRPAFSPELVRARFLDEYGTPRLLDPEWEWEWEFAITDPIRNARLLPDGSVAYLCYTAAVKPALWAQSPGQAIKKLVEDGVATDAYSFGFDSISGMFIWSRQQDSKGLHFARADLAGQTHPALRYDFSHEISPLIYEPSRQVMLSRGDPVADGYPWGLAVVGMGGEPEGTDVRAGDVLIADEGHREFIPRFESLPGLWVLKADEDKPARRLGELPRQRYWPIDVAVHRQGIFLLSRSEAILSDAEEERDRTQRVLRWDLEGFHACSLSQSIYDPTAIVADPSSSDLYVAQGGFIASSSPLIQRIFRLRLVAPDTYDVQVVAERFGRLSICGLGMSSDGKRLVITDEGHGAVVVLKRR